MQSGWQVSYYLPWPDLLQPNADRAAQAIAEVVRAEGIGNVSYDLKADHIVRSLLTPLLPEGVRLHAWTTDWRFDDKELPRKVAPYRHLSTLLVKFSSRFHF